LPCSQRCGPDCPNSQQTHVLLGSLTEDQISPSSGAGRVPSRNASSFDRGHNWRPIVSPHAQFPPGSFIWRSKGELPLSPCHDFLCIRGMSLPMKCGSELAMPSRHSQQYHPPLPFTSTQRRPNIQIEQASQTQ